MQCVTSLHLSASNHAKGVTRGFALASRTKVYAVNTIVTMQCVDFSPHFPRFQPAQIRSMLRSMPVSAGPDPVYVAIWDNFRPFRTGQAMT